MARKKAIPLTAEQKQLEKDVKRINERINEVAKLVGTNSYAYNQWYSAIKSVIPGKYRATSKHGIMQIARNKDFYRTANQKKTIQAVQRLLGMKTAGQLKKQAKQSLKDEGTKKPTTQEIEDRVKAIDETNSFVNDNRDMFYIDPKKSKRAYDIAHIKGRRKSYDEMEELISIYKKITSTGDTPTDNIFGDL